MSEPDDEADEEPKRDDMVGFEFLLESKKEGGNIRRGRKDARPGMRTRMLLWSYRGDEVYGSACFTQVVGESRLKSLITTETRPLRRMTLHFPPT